MISLASKAHFRQRVIRYAAKYGVTEASRQHRISRQAICGWLSRYDGRSWKSLMGRSHRPYSYPREHTAEKKALIKRYWKKNRDDRLILWSKLREAGYTRLYKSMLRVIKRMQLQEEMDRRKGYKPKLYKRADYPGQKIQADVKFVPSYCVSNGKKYYQYTAADECTRLVFRELYDEHSIYSPNEVWERYAGVM